LNDLLDKDISLRSNINTKHDIITVETDLILKSLMLGNENILDLVPAGPIGPAGADGVDGIGGIQGEAGPAGATGIDGSDGVNGDHGITRRCGPRWCCWY
jgi:hypothetical protein